MDIKEHTSEYESYLIKLAESSITRGVIEEPRVYFERLYVTQQGDADPVLADPLTFVNGEQFPVRILFMTATCVNTGEGAPANSGYEGERLMQQIGMRLRFHDQFYMRPDFVRMPVWGTHVVASSDAINEFTAAHKPWRPLVLSSRDTLEVRVRPNGLAGLTPTTQYPWTVTVSATGVGIFSKRPYFFSGTVDLTNNVTQTLDTAAFKNDGAEPILITDIIHNASWNDALAGNRGLLRFVDVGVRQIGNGTNADWVVTGGGEGLDVQNMAPMANWGTYSGRAVVHRFPGQGLIWEPGEGIQVALQSFLPSGSAAVSVALLGYIAVQ